MRENPKDETMDNQHTLDVDLSWLAGIVEGEGCITLERGGDRRKSGNRFLIPTIVIANTNPILILAVRTVLDRIQVHYDIREKKWTNGWKTTIRLRIINQANVGRFLECIRPFMRSKTSQCDLVLSFIKLRKSNREMKIRNHGAEEAMVVEIRKLNQKGDRDCTPRTEQSA